MTRLRLILMVLVVFAVAAPVAHAASDLYANLGPGGSTSPAVDRFPLGNYRLDWHFTAVKASLTGGVVTLHVLRPQELKKSNPVKFPCN